MALPTSLRCIACVLLAMLQGVASGQTPAAADDDAFAAAVASGDPQAVLPLLGAGRVNMPVPPFTHPTGGNPTGKQPALVAAARAGHASLVRLLIANGADLRTQGGHALAEAVAEGRVAAAKTLLEAGVKPDGSERELRMASAVSGGSVEIAELLLKQGADLARLPAEVLDLVASEKSEAMRTWLRKHGVRVPDRTVDDRLMTAIWNDDLPAVRRLISERNTGWFMGGRWAGMAVRPTDLPDVRRMVVGSNIHWHGGARAAAAAAAATGDKDLLAAVVEAASGTNPPRIVNDGDALLRRPLWFAAARGDAGMAEWLLARGALVDAPTFSEQTALGVATSLGHKAVAEVLLKHGARRVEAVPENAAKKTADGILAFPKGFKAPALAMAPVTIDDAWHESATAANDLGAALEAGALNLPDVRWVERAEVERLGGEWATESFGGNDPAAALQKGRLARADWMVTTRILPDEGRGRAMIFEVLDTRTAESLALRTVALPGRLGWPFKFDAASVPALLAEMRPALAAAAHTVEEARGRQRLACLFFANKAPTDRFATLAGDAMEMMSAIAGSPDEKLPHVVRFRRSRAVAGEAELAAAGWLDQGEQGLQQVADAFAWGSITEVGNGDAQRDDVMLKLTWEVWTGGADTVKHEAVCRAGDAAATMRSLSKKVLASLPPKGTPTTLKLREAMAQRMMEQAKALGVGGENPGSAEARRRWRARVALLEAAHFLNPERVTLEATMIVERWHPMLSAKAGTSERSALDFLSDLQRRAAWGRFAKAHGYAPLRSVFADDPMRRERWLWPNVAGEIQVDGQGHVISSYRGIAPKMTLCHAELIVRLIREIAQLYSCVPSDLPPRIREQWLASLGLEYAELMAAAAKTEEGAMDLRLSGSLERLASIPDKALRYRTAVVMLRGSADRSRQRPDDWGWHCSEMLALAEDAGLAEEALAVVREARAASEKNKPAIIARDPSKPSASNSTWQIAQGHMAERLAAEQARVKGRPGWLDVAPEVRELTGYYRSGTVVAMSSHRGKLYLAVTGRKLNESYHTTVWEHDLAKGSFTLVSGFGLALPQDQIGLTAHDSGLWLWTSLNGIWHRDWDTGAVTHHESKSGLPTDQIFCAADVGGTICFGGGKRNDGALFAWDTATRGWRVLHWPGPARDEIANGMRVVTMGGELFVRTFSTQAAVNPKTDTWRDLSGYLGRRQISSSESLVAGSTLWCWGSRNFTRFDLATMTHRPVTPVGDGPAVTGEPGFLAETADCVWAISHDDFLDFRPGLNIHRLFAANKSDGTVQAAILLPMVCRIRCAVVVGQTLWLGVARGQSSNQEFQGMPCLVRVPLPR